MTLKDLLLKIPYFRKQKESFDRIQQEVAKNKAEGDARREEYRLLEKRMDERDAEISRRQEIREDLLFDQRFKKLRISRQTF